MQELGDNTIQRVDWQNVFPVVLLPRAYKFALGVRVIFLALLGLVIVFFLSSLPFLSACLFGTTESDALYEVSQPPDIVSLHLRVIQGMPGNAFPSFSENSTWARPTHWNEYLLTFDRNESSPVTVMHAPRRMAHPWANLTATGYAVFSYKTMTHLSRFIVLLVIWAWLGGMITRIVALRFAQDRRESFSQLFGFMRTKWLSYVGAIVLPMIGIFLALLPIWLIGWIWQFLPPAWGFDLAHLILAFPFALVAVLMTVGLMFGWPLMFAAVSAEGSDAFDAISRGFSYVYQRPMQFVFYHLCNLVIYAIGIVIAYFVFHQTVTLIGYNPAGLMILFNSFAFAYFLSSQTVIYFLLRRSCDATPYDQVYLGDVKKRTLPPFGTGKNGEPELKSEKLEVRS